MSDGRTEEFEPPNAELLIDAHGALSCIETNKMPTRRQSEAAWRAIKEGLLVDEDVCRWASFVAKAVVEDVIDSDCLPREKPDHALRAIKIYGTLAEVDILLDIEASYWALSEALKIPQNASLRTRAKALQHHEKYKHLTVEEITERLRRRTRKIPTTRVKNVTNRKTSR